MIDFKDKSLKPQGWLIAYYDDMWITFTIDGDPPKYVVDLIVERLNRTFQVQLAKKVMGVFDPDPETFEIGEFI